MAFLKNITISGTGYLSLPVGTTAERLTPATSVLVPFTTVGVVAGGWTCPAGVRSVEVLVVAGGSGGGHSIYGGPGGGAGGVCYANNYAVTPGTNYSVTVGAGGANYSNGGDSNFGPIIARAAGSGTGGGHSNPPAQGSAPQQPSNTVAGVVGYGNKGGAHEYVSPYPCGGGGGAGEPGGTGDAYLGRPGNGGKGVRFNITGVQTYYGGGGGATQYNGNAYGQGIGGLGGGGSGVWAGTGQAGVANTGGGGGGGGGNGVAGSGGAGGSGVVYIRYIANQVVPSIGLGSLRINRDNNAGLEFYSAGNNWQPMAIPFLTRTILTTSYMMGGYKDSSAWNNVNKTTHASDTTYNLGDNSIERSFNYQSGACGKNIGFIFGAGNGHAISSNYVIAYNMRSETQYTTGFSRTLNYAKYNTGTIFQEHYIAWNTGGGGTNIDEFNLITETKTLDIGGFSSTGMWGMSGENFGIWYWEEDSRHFTFATRQTMVRHGQQTGAHSQQKSTQSKQTNCYAGHEGSYNGGNNFRRTNMITNTTGGTMAKPSTNSGEENYAMGQDWAYCIGLYNGSGQVNVSFRFNYATEAGYTGGTSMEPKGHAGASSGFCVWRGN
jgi:hypothetical protein